MKNRSFSLFMVVASAVLFAAPRPAAAWNARTHRELARQAILWLLRSSTPELRLAGVAIVSAGEGVRADATGKRNWLLSKEAEYVDIYRDVLVRDKGDSPLPDLAYDLRGEGFTKYNHFLLIDQTMSGYSIERFGLSYPIKKGDPACSSDPDRLTLGEGQNDTMLKRLGRVSFDVSCRTCEQVAQIYGGTHKINFDGTECIVLVPRWMDQHSDEPGYVQGIDPTLMVDFEKDPMAAALRMVGSRELQQFCQDELESFIKNGIEVSTVSSYVGSAGIDVPVVGTILGWLAGKVLNNIPGIGPVLDKVLQSTLGEVIAPIAANYLARKCPFAVGVWVNDNEATYWEKITYQQWNRKVTPSLAMIRLGSINQSTIKPDMVQNVWLNDIRWHPVHQIATWGTLGFLDYDAAVRQSSDFLMSLSGVSSAAKQRTREMLVQVPNYFPSSNGDTLSQWMTSGERVPSQYSDVSQGITPKGQLLHLGQLLHAMSDLGVAGHTTGHLLGAEHIALENRVNEDVGDFEFEGDRLLENGEIVPAEYVASKTGALAIRPNTQDQSAIYELDFLIDTDDAQRLIREALQNTAVGGPESVIESLGKTVARTTKTATVDTENARLLQSPDTDPNLRREFATRSLVNNVVALVRAMQLYYGAEKFAEMAKKVNWTHEDAEILRKASQPAPTFGPAIEKTLVQTDGEYGLYVDNYYQEYQASGCFLRSSNWCDEKLGVPCPTDANFCKPPFINRTCWTRGPNFIDASKVPGWVVLSPENHGGEDDQVHITGVFDTRQINLYPAPKPGEPYGHAVSIPNEAVNQMDVEHFRGGLSSSAGTMVKLPPGALAKGVAIWCTGPNVGDQRDDLSGQSRVECTWQYVAVDPFFASPCDDLARAQWERMNRIREWAGNLKPGIPPMLKPGPLPIVPPGKLYSKAAAETIPDLAERYGTSEIDLSKHLASSQGMAVTLLDPSPYGKASFIWRDASGLRKTTTILRDSNIVTTTTAK